MPSNRFNSTDSVGCLKTIDEQHSKVHDGLSFTGNHYEKLAGAGSAVTILITAPATGAHYHFIAEIDVDGPGLLTLSRAPNATATNGTVLTALNDNENSSNTNTLVHVANGTYTSSGTIMRSFVIGGSSGVGAQGAIIGGGKDGRFEIEFGLGSVHLIRWVADLASCRTAIRTHFYRES